MAPQILKIQSNFRAIRERWNCLLSGNRPVYLFPRQIFAADHSISIRLPHNPPAFFHLESQSPNSSCARAIVFESKRGNRNTRRANALSTNLDLTRIGSTTLGRNRPTIRTSKHDDVQLISNSLSTGSKMFRPNSERRNVIGDAKGRGRTFAKRLAIENNQYNTRSRSRFAQIQFEPASEDRGQERTSNHEENNVDQRVAVRRESDRDRRE